MSDSLKREIVKGVGWSFADKKKIESEQKNITIARKSIVAAADIKSEDIFTEKNITIKRSGIGI